MIQWFKDVTADSIIFKAFMTLMILSFGIWGIGDVIAPGIDPNVAIQGGRFEVKAVELQRQYTMQLDRLRESLGPEAATDPSLKKLVLDNTVNELRQEAINNMAAFELGIDISKETVRDNVMAQDAFKDETGAFSSFKFNELLVQNQMTEQTFAKLVETDLRQRALMQPVGVNAGAPNALVDKLFAYRAETRIADTLLIPVDAMQIAGKPTDEHIKKTYDENISAFTAPEFRTVSAVLLVSDDLVTPESIDESVVKAFYDENAARYKTPEMRKVSQLVFETKEQAEAARALMAPGDTLAKLAQKAKIGEPIDLGERSLTDPIVLPFGDAMKTPVNEISQPVESDLGWHLLQISSVTPETVMPYESVKAEIRKSLAADKATDALFDVSTKLEDEVAAGTPFEEAAKIVGGRYYNVTVDRQGNGPLGAMEIIGLFEKVKQETFYNLAFTTPVGTETALTQVDGGYYVLRVDSSTPPAPKDMEKVRPEVASLWLKQEKLKAAKSLADNMAADLTPAMTMSSMADKDKRLLYAQLGPLTRFGESLKPGYVVDSKRVGPDMLSKLFNAKVGDVFSSSVSGGYIVVRLKTIVPAAPEGDLAATRESLQAATRDAVRQDLMQQFSGALATRYPVTLNTKAIQDIGGVAQ